MCIRTQKKGVVTPQETDPDMLMSVQESPVEVWVNNLALGQTMVGLMVISFKRTYASTPQLPGLL